MAAKKPTVAVPTKEMREIDRLNAMVSELTSGIESVRNHRDKVMAERDDAQRVASQRKARITELENEVGQLREDLHTTTVEKARLEGYIDRAREFDPPAETKLVTVPEEMVRHFRNDGYGNAVMPDAYGSRSSGARPWYKRDI